MFSKSENEWEVVSGAVEAGESILDAAKRELWEEAGSKIDFCPLGVIHTHSYEYDVFVTDMINIHYAMRYHSGAIEPNDDMIGACFEWMSLNQLESKINQVRIPQDRHWLFERAISLNRMDRPGSDLLEYP